MVEWSITPVLKTGVLRGTGGSNPSLSAKKTAEISAVFFDHNFYTPITELLGESRAQLLIIMVMIMMSAMVPSNKVDVTSKDFLTQFTWIHAAQVAIL